MMSSGTGPGNPKGAGGGKRGEIRGWSAASRRRLREALLTLEPDEGMITVGFSGTVPGPVLSRDEVKRVWNSFAWGLQDSGCCMVWRLEIQERQQFHWHGTISGFPKVIPVGCGIKVNIPLGHAVVLLWCHAIDLLGTVNLSGTEWQNRYGLRSASSRMAMPGAQEHAARVEVKQADSLGAWLRYLQDHASKRKQDQIPEGVGRHWGIVGRKYYRRAIPDEAVSLSDKAYGRFRRAYERLATPHVSDEGCAFGNRLGFRCHRGRRGRAVSFVNPATVKRLLEWARVSP